MAIKNGLLRTAVASAVADFDKSVCTGELSKMRKLWYYAKEAAASKAELVADKDDDGRGVSGIVGKAGAASEPAGRTARLEYAPGFIAMA